MFQLQLYYDKLCNILLSQIADLIKSNLPSFAKCFPTSIIVLQYREAAQYHQYELGVFRGTIARVFYAQIVPPCPHAKAFADFPSCAERNMEWHFANVMYTYSILVHDDCIYETVGEVSEKNPKAAATWRRKDHVLQCAEHFRKRKEF